MPETILFVCSGNTCRSPMAAAIAAHIARQSGLALRAHSAGSAANPGQPITPHAGRALDELDIAHDHQSRALTPDLIRASDRIFGMEQKHLLAVGQVPHAVLLDAPDEIADPLGLGRDRYRALARHLVALMPARLGI